MYPAFIRKLKDNGIETTDLTVERVRTHCRSTGANPTFVRYAELDMTSKMIPIDMLFGPNGIWNGSGNIHQSTRLEESFQSGKERNQQDS